MLLALLIVQCAASVLRCSSSIPRLCVRGDAFPVRLRGILFGPCPIPKSPASLLFVTGWKQLMAVLLVPAPIPPIMLLMVVSLLRLLNFISMLLAFQRRPLLALSLVLPLLLLLTSLPSRPSDVLLFIVSIHWTLLLLSNNCILSFRKRSGTLLTKTVLFLSVLRTGRIGTAPVTLMTPWARPCTSVYLLVCALISSPVPARPLSLRVSTVLMRVVFLFRS